MSEARRAYIPPSDGTRPVPRFGVTHNPTLVKLKGKFKVTCDCGWNGAMYATSDEAIANYQGHEKG